MFRKGVLALTAGVILYGEVRKSKKINERLPESYQSIIEETPSLIDFLIDRIPKSHKQQESPPVEQQQLQVVATTTNVLENTSHSKFLTDKLVEPQWNCVTPLKAEGMFIEIQLKDQRGIDFRNLAKTAAKQVIEAQKKLNSGSSSTVSIGFSSSFFNRGANNLFSVSDFSFYEKRGPHSNYMPCSGGHIMLHFKGPIAECVELSRSIVEAIPSQYIHDIDIQPGFALFGNNHHTQEEQQHDISNSNLSINVSNPKELEQRCNAALIQNTGGSFCLVQKWVHNFEKMQEMSEDQRNQIFYPVNTKSIGNEKSNPEESARILASLPKISHISKVLLLDQDSKRMSIVRQSLSWGHPYGAGGLYFCAYSSDVDIFKFMITRMCLGQRRDPVFDYSTCLGGNLYYCPSQNQLTNLASLE